MRRGQRGRIENTQMSKTVNVIIIIAKGIKDEKRENTTNNYAMLATMR